MIRISQDAEKAPDDIYSCQLNQKVLLVVRNGLLVRIEKEIIRAGQKVLLKTIKSNLEKSYLHNNGHFEMILARMVIDSFVDWNFDFDKSIIAFVLKPKEMRGNQLQ